MLDLRRKGVSETALLNYVDTARSTQTRSTRDGEVFNVKDYPDDDIVRYRSKSDKNRNACKDTTAISTRSSSYNSHSRSTSSNRLPRFPSAAESELQSPCPVRNSQIGHKQVPSTGSDFLPNKMTPITQGSYKSQQLVKGLDELRLTDYLNGYKTTGVDVLGGGRTLLLLSREYCGSAGFDSFILPFLGDCYRELRRFYRNIGVVGPSDASEMLKYTVETAFPPKIKVFSDPYSRLINCFLLNLEQEEVDFHGSSRLIVSLCDGVVEKTIADSLGGPVSVGLHLKTLSLMRSHDIARLAQLSQLGAKKQGCESFALIDRGTSAKTTIHYSARANKDKQDFQLPCMFDGPGETEDSDAAYTFTDRGGDATSRNVHAYLDFTELDGASSYRVLEWEEDDADARQSCDSPVEGSILASETQQDCKDTTVDETDMPQTYIGLLRLSQQQAALIDAYVTRDSIEDEKETKELATECPSQNTTTITTFETSAMSNDNLSITYDPISPVRCYDSVKVHMELCASEENATTSSDDGTYNGGEWSTRWKGSGSGHYSSVVNCG